MADVQNDQTNDVKLLTEIRNIQKKQLFWQKITTCAVVAASIVIIFSAFKIVPKVGVVLDNIEDAAVSANNSLVEVDVMIDSITNASENLNKLVDENGATLTEAVTNLSEVDYEGLNQAIRDLQDTVGPLAEFMKVFQ